MIRMISTVSIAQAQAHLPKLVSEIELGPVILERRGKVAAFLIAPGRMAAIVETMEILANKSASKAIADHSKGKLKFKDVSCLED